MKKWMFVALFFVLVVYPVSANFGIVPLDTDVETDTGSSDFQIGLINMGSDTLKMQLSTRNLTNGEVEFENEQFDLEPSEVSSNPSGSNWYYLGGRYVQVKFIDFKYTASANKGVEKFYVEVNAEQSGAKEGLSSNIAQVREVDYKVIMSEENFNSNNWGTNTDINEKNNSSQQKINDSSSSKRSDQFVNRTKSQNDNEDFTRKSSKESKNYNIITILLLLTILFILSYIFHEV